MKNLALILLLATNSFFAQEKEPYTFGRITQFENDLTVYEKDSTANAVFLNEYGKTSFHDTDRRIVIRTKYYGKVKIFKKEGFEHATVKIPIYKNKSASEKVTDIRAITYNSGVKTSLSQKKIFTDKINDNWSEVKFTMPNLKENSIIEYEYTFETPFIFNFKGWNFQANIPKIYSEFYALIPGNYVYNRSLVGYYKLSENSSDLKRNCFYVSGIAKQADCEELTYAMKDIPAFIEEDFMTSKDNYISAIKFELSESTDFRGVKDKYTKTWKDVDKEFRGEKSIGQQLKKDNYIKKQLPIALTEGKNDLTKAKKIYNFIKNHFTWDTKLRVFNDVNIKNAYDNKIGNATEINITLINALNTVGFDTEIMLLSTRSNGLPTKIHPVMTDFNYAIAKLNIGEKSYLLDATSKELPFGMLPYRTLNGYGRVMNFKEGSYWYDIIPMQNNDIRTSMNVSMNENGDFIGKMYKTYNGYEAIDKRNDVNTLSEDDYLVKAEETYGGIEGKLIIDSYKNSDLENIDKPFRELFEITIESDLSGNLLIFNPFMSSTNNSNPFKLKERTYPVDFGYPRSSQFSLKLIIPENYAIESVPEKAAFQLPNDGGTYVFFVDKKGNEINLLIKQDIKRSFFSPQEYPYLKEFYNQIIKTQKSLITLEKIN